MNTRTFTFVGIAGSRTMALTMTVPVLLPGSSPASRSNDGEQVLTACFRPPEYCAPYLPISSAGLRIDDFINECRKQIVAIEDAAGHESLFNEHLAGLLAVVLDGLADGATLSFNELLLHTDCFCLLLEADGFPAEEIRDLYPHIVRAITSLYPRNIENSEAQI